MAILCAAGVTCSVGGSQVLFLFLCGATSNEYHSDDTCVSTRSAILYDTGVWGGVEGEDEAGWFLFGRDVGLARRVKTS